MSDQGELFRVTEAKRPTSMSRGAAVGRRAGDSYGVPFQRHSDTSKAAAAALRGSQTLRALVYEAIASSGDRGMTDPEAQAHLGLSGSTQRPRRVRLVELGLVRDSGNRRASEARRLCTVWVAT
tara:strand:+ start:1085 stop:1456 length:372 start_codon:yes stop_codon:yes gene_type:complete